MIAQPVSINIDEYGEFRVTFPLSRDAFEHMIDRHCSTKDADEGDVFNLFNCDSLGSINGRAYAYAVWDRTDGPRLVIAGGCELEGDDALDHTRTPSELGLSDRLEIAAIARKLFS